MQIRRQHLVAKKVMLLISVLFVVIQVNNLQVTECAWLKSKSSTQIGTTNEQQSILNEYLAKYGYLYKSSAGASSSTRDSMREAISKFQRMAGLTVTGEADTETIQVMRRKRCGNPDISETTAGRTTGGSDAGLGRVKRDYKLTELEKWDSRVLTYRIMNSPSKFDGKSEDLALQIRKALNVWSGVAQIDFVAKHEGQANIEFLFIGSHKDELKPFDGPGLTLAHAFFPHLHKGIHFDDDEDYTVDSDGDGVDIFQLAVHEIGHTLGIDHNEGLSDSIMYPLYAYRDNFTLHVEDINAVQELFGRRRNDSLDEPANLCFDSAIDAITRTEDGTTYMFKGDFYWRMMNDDIAKDTPGRIKNDWDGLPDSLDTAFTLPDGRTYFFKYDQCWIFRNRKRESGPRLINSMFPGLPESIEAAFYWNTDQQLYFFKGEGYWKYSIDGQAADKDYPRNIAGAWRGVPSNLNDVFTWQDNKTYFFKDNNYYRFNVDDDEVDTRAKPSFPRSTSYWWFGCDTLNAVPAGR